METTTNITSTAYMVAFMNQDNVGTNAGADSVRIIGSLNPCVTGRQHSIGLISAEGSSYQGAQLAVIEKFLKGCGLHENISFEWDGTGISKITVMDDFHMPKKQYKRTS